MAPGLTDDRYFSERLVGEVARENQNISEDFWRGFVALVESRSRDGWFSERYPGFTALRPRCRLRRPVPSVSPRPSDWRVNAAVTSRCGRPRGHRLPTHPEGGR